MKSDSVAKLRIPILLALAVAEALGLFYFHGQPWFNMFFVLSTVALMLLVPLLWLEVLRRYNVRYARTVLFPAAFLGLTNSWRQHDPVMGWLWGIIFAINITVIFQDISKAIANQGGRA
jgi:hypothetical protein